MAVVGLLCLPCVYFDSSLAVHFLLSHVVFCTERVKGNASVVVWKPRAFMHFFPLHFHEITRLKNNSRSPRPPR